MTDRIRGFTVVLDKDYREDDIEGLRLAIARFKGVLKVSPIKDNEQAWISEQRALHQLRERLWEALADKE